MKVFLIILASFFGLLVIVWLGLQIKPHSFSPLYEGNGTLTYEKLPDGLPVPVERFYREVYGEEFPVIETAVISGRAWIKPFGNIRLPARYQFIHQAGENYRHYIEATFFGIPIFRVNETYIDGKAWMGLPFGIVENEPKIDQAANLGLWAESIWLPSLFLTDTRVSWDHLDDHTAVLSVPFNDVEEKFIVRFDPDTGLITMFEAMRYKQADDTQKTLWFNEADKWDMLNGRLVLVEAGLTWSDDRLPWAIFSVEKVIYNQDVSEVLFSVSEDN